VQAPTDPPKSLRQASWHSDLSCKLSQQRSQLLSLAISAPPLKLPLLARRNGVIAIRDLELISTLSLANEADEVRRPPRDRRYAAISSI
jgi:hypothetical protein